MPMLILQEFAARKYQKRASTGNYYRTLVYYDLFSREHTKKMYAGGVLKEDVTWYSRYALQVQVEGGRIELVTEQLGGKKAIRGVPAPSCACAFIKDFLYDKVDGKYNQYEKTLLVNFSLADVEFQQHEVYTVDHPVDSSRVALAAARKITVSEELCANYRKTEFASSVQLKHIKRHYLFIKKILSS